MMEDDAVMPDDDPRIEQWIRAWRQKQEPADLQISDEILHAYLTGRATAEEKSEVRRALSGSQRLRQELVDLASYLEKLATDDAAVAYDKAVAPRFDPGQDRFGTEPTIVTRSFPNRIRAFLRQLVVPPRVWVAAPVTAAAVLVLSVAPRVSWVPIASRPVAFRSLDAGSFAMIWGTTRGSGAADPEEAATRELHRCLRLQDGSLEFEPPVATGAAKESAQGRTLATVHLVDKWRRKLRVIELQAPAELQDPAPVKAIPSVMVWLAVLPGRGGDSVQLYSYALTRESLGLRWGAEQRRRGALLATHEQDGRFYASACVPFDLGSH